MLRVVVLVPIALQVASPSFVPARDHGQKTAAEWVAQLTPGSHDTLPAIWSLFYADERSAECIGGLKSTLASKGDSARAADTVLNHWMHAIDTLSAREFNGLPGFVSADAIFQVPELEASPRDAASQSVLRAVLDALRSGEGLAKALDELLSLERRSEPGPSGDFARTVNWAREFAGSAYGEAYARAITAELDSQQCDALAFERLVRRIPKLGRARWAAAKPLVAALNRPELAEIGLANLSLLFREELRPTGDWEIHHWLLHGAQISDPDAVELAIAFALHELSPPIEAATLDRFHVAIVTLPALAQELEPRLLAIAGQDGALGDAAFRILAHLGVRDETLRRRYIETLGRWTDFSSDAIQRFPCWKDHDEETLAALEGAMGRSGVPLPFDDRLRFAGQTDARRSRVARRFLEDSFLKDAAFSFQGVWFTTRGFRGLLPLTPATRPASRVQQLALRIATLKEEGSDFAAEERELAEILTGSSVEMGAGGGDSIQWGLFYARELGLHSDAIVQGALKYLPPGPDNSDIWRDAAAAYFDTAELTLAEELEVRRLRPWKGSGDPKHWTEAIVNPMGTARLKGMLAIELVPSIRMSIYGGDARALADLLPITPLIQRDEDYLLATLERAPAELREWAVHLVEQRNLDTPRLREMIRRRRGDADRGVRDAAASLIGARGW